jgi:dienelactone hydrolase
MRILIGIFMALLFCLPGQAQTQISHPKTGTYDHKVRLSEIVTDDQLAKFSTIYKEDENLSWRIVVPTNYDPNDPPGVFIYVSPTRKGTPPRDWIAVLERQNLIYISAHRAGNRVPVNRRMSNAVLGLTLITSMYKTDPKRFYVSGFSGGARTSTMIVEHLPNIFTGALFIGGAKEWRGEKDEIKSTLKNGAYVFLTGTRDHTRRETHRTYWEYRKAGVERIKLMIIKKLGHQLPEAREFEEALDFLTRPDVSTDKLGK